MKVWKKPRSWRDRENMPDDVQREFDRHLSVRLYRQPEYKHWRWARYFSAGYEVYCELPCGKQKLRWFVIETVVYQYKTKPPKAKQVYRSATRADVAQILSGYGMTVEEFVSDKISLSRFSPAVEAEVRQDVFTSLSDN